MTQSKSGKPKSASGSRRRAGARTAARRWWILPVALGLGGLAFYVLVNEGSVGSMSAGPPPMERIDEESRAELERVIGEAHQTEGTAR